ncbi:hypothetical protein ACKP2L_01245 [Oenococcus alcoholitolerans]|uniref:hypothetical protein n=1 Tax=Oenococcus alcoholitolerans TaxID=931074 RepID=UPI003F6E55BF
MVDLKKFKRFIIAFAAIGLFFFFISAPNPDPSSQQSGQLSSLSTISKVQQRTRQLNCDGKKQRVVVDKVILKKGNKEQIIFIKNGQAIYKINKKDNNNFSLTILKKNLNKFISNI